MLVRSVPGSHFFFYPKVVKGTVVRIRIRGRIVHVDVERTRIRAVIEIRKANRSTPAETTVASGTKPLNQISYSEALSAAVKRQLSRHLLRDSPRDEVAAKGTVVRRRSRGRRVHVDEERTRSRAAIERRKAKRSTPAE